MYLQDIERALENHPSPGESADNWYYWQNLVWDRPNPPGAIPTISITVPGLGEVSVVERVGGGEGEGDHMHIVFRVADSHVEHFFKKSGYYSSWDSSDWDGAFVEVHPREKTITVYEER